MKKGILSFTVVLAFAIVNVLGCFSASAVEGASVVARKIYVDDDFNDREVGKYTKASGAKGISDETATDYEVVEEAGGNKCIKNIKEWRTVNIWGKNIDSDRIGLSFKYKIPKFAKADGGAYFQLNFGGKMVLFFKNDEGEDKKDYIKFGSEQGSKWLHNTGLDCNVWTQVDVVFEKRNDGKMCKMYMEKLYINGVPVNLKANLGEIVPYNVAVDNAAPKWWESGFSIKLTQTSKAGFNFDDIMLYEPTAETGFESVDFVNSTITIRNANADALKLTGSNLIVAAYDKGDNLLGTAVKEIDANLASGESTSVNIAGTAPTGTAYYKFFAWNNLNEMVPLFTQAEVTAK